MFKPEIDERTLIGLRFLRQPSYHNCKMWFPNWQLEQRGWVFRPCTMGPRGPLPISLKEPGVTPAPQFGPTPQRLSLQRSDSELLRCFYEDTSSIRDGYSSTVIADPMLTRCRHLAGKNAHRAEYRQESERKVQTSQAEYYFDDSRPIRQREQTCVSIHSWNPRPRRGTPDSLKTALQGSGMSLLSKKR